MKSIAAFENTKVLSVSKNTLKTFINDAKCTPLITRKPPNNDRQPDRISVRFPSTNSQIQLTI